MNQAEIGDALRRLEALQAAAADAAPAVAALVALAVERGEAKPYKSIGLTQAVAYWVQQQPFEPPTPLQAGPDGEELGDLLLAWARR